MVVDKEFIGAIIGPGGKIIQEIQKETKSTIVIEEIDEKGYVDIVAVDKASIDAAIAWIEGIVAVPEVGKVYDGTVKNITQFGAFIEVLPGKDGLLHISEIDWKKTMNVSDVLKEGQKLEVKIIGVDERSGKIKLSRKVLLPRPPRNNY